MRKRLTNKHLPERVYLKHGAYYYLNRQSKWIRLGKTLPEAMASWAAMVEPPIEIYTMQQLFDRYMLEIAPQKSAESYRANRVGIKALSSAFGHLSPIDITAPVIYQFMDKRGKIAPVMANREKSLLSHIFTTAIRWGIVTTNPCKNVMRIKEVHRDRYVTDTEYFSVRSLATENIKFIMDFAYFTGLRQADVLKLKLNEVQENGIYIQVNKTKKKLLIEWAEELKKLVELAKNRAALLHSEYLFPNNNGQKYTSSGFQTLWQRLIKKALAAKVIEETFRFHDIRRKTATEMEQIRGRESARQLLGHNDQKTTAIYISGMQKVKPLK
ncbi:MAG: tyrosine-type recombinase/integrase [Gammaproteobacteria bacterium]